MIQRTINSSVAKSVFYRDCNDIDIFIEDTAKGYRKIYKELLRRVFGSEVNIEQIFPIGSKKDVICECEKHQHNNERKKLFIIDGDLLLFYNVKYDYKNLYILKRYCIENYLVDPKAIIEVIYEETKELDRDDIENELNFDEWVLKNEEKLIELFKIYALCFKFESKLPTVNYKVIRLCGSQLGFLCEIKTKERIEELKNSLISQIGRDIFENEYIRLTNMINQNENKMLKYVSGKDYLLPLIFYKIRNVIDTKPDNYSLKLRISQKCDLKELTEIKNFVNL